MLKVEDIARACYEANRALCLAIGDDSQKHWDETEDWQRESSVLGVKWRLENPDAPASAQHDEWVKEKLKHGWSYGTVKNPEQKVHPCVVPYDRLPIEQRAKDALFVGVVNSLKSLLTAKE